MCIVTWGCSKPAIFVLAAEDKVQDSIARKCFRLSEEVEGCETPIDAA